MPPRLPAPLVLGQIAVGPAKRFTRHEMEAFLRTVGDSNTVHDSPDGGDPLLPGMLVGSLISGVMGTQLPGPGSIYLSQTLKFRKEAPLSGEYHAVVEVTALSPSRHAIRMSTSVVTSSGEVIADGEALGKNAEPLLWKSSDA
eukprot:TRINITY_DN21571_c0_g1_i1.p1 TRINITY_DN21571_c0_g1~~TRINITY_DN21571_c0_g1_i1.p1  ORF type:complete len:159 (+),score=47.73 TRINITY_DN21571_c0_g1_i1:49-477(+)